MPDIACRGCSVHMSSDDTHGMPAAPCSELARTDDALGHVRTGSLLGQGLAALSWRRRPTCSGSTTLARLASALVNLQDERTGDVPHAHHVGCCRLAGELNLSGQGQGQGRGQGQGQGQVQGQGQG